MNADRDKVTILEPESQKPVFLTSHQLFLDVLSSESVQSIPFAIHAYTVNPFHPLHTVSLTKVAGRDSFRSKNLPKPKKADGLKQSTLRFRLPDSPRKRKKRAKGKEQPQKKAAAKAKVGPPKSMEDLAAMETDWAAEFRGGPEVGACESSSSSTSSSDSSSETEFSECGESGDSDSDSVRDEPEEVFLTAEAKAEERQIASILQSHQQLMEQRGQDFCPKGASEASASEIDNHAASSSGKGKGRSTGGNQGIQRSSCNKEIGLIKLETQKAARLATCRHCGSKITRGSARFAYAFSTTKFEAFLHPGCTAPHLQQENADLEKALAFLERAKECDHPPHETEAIKQVENDLSHLR